MEAIPAGIRLFLCCGNQRDKKGFLDPTGVQAVSTLAARFSAAQVSCCEVRRAIPVGMLLLCLTRGGCAVDVGWRAPAARWFACSECLRTAARFHQL